MFNLFDIYLSILLYIFLRPAGNKNTLDVENAKSSSTGGQLSEILSLSLGQTSFTVLLNNGTDRRNPRPKCSLSVCFVGEAGVDTGEIKKEFLTLVTVNLSLVVLQNAVNNQFC